MRKFKTFFALMSVILIAITACDEIEQSELTLDLSKKAKIRAYFFAELDKTTQGLEYAPNGTKILISIPNSSFNSAASGTWVDSATVTNGLIEVEVPATSTGVTATIKPAEFTYAQVQSYGSVSSTISKIFSVTAAQTISIFPNEIKTKEITYDGQNQLDNFVEKVDLKFEARANVDENVADEFVPASTVVSIYTSTWSTTATVGAGGRFDVSVPKGETIYFRFEANKALIGPPASIKKYKYTTNFSDTDETTPVLQDIDFGNGVLWE